MTRPKGTVQDQVTRLRLRTAEAIIKQLEAGASVGDHQVFLQLRECLKDAYNAPELLQAIEEFNQRLASLESILGQGAVVREHDGTIRMG